MAPRNLSYGTFGAGCFWCIEAVILNLRGVESVVSGYSGGASVNPTYREVCSGSSGHAEVIQVTFDSSVLSYAELLSVFMTSHDPTQHNGQGADIGTQYRSVIYYHDDEQKNVAQQIIISLNEALDKKLATELSPLENFYPAEAGHQDYYNRNAGNGYCQVVIEPKLQKLRMHHQQLLKTNNDKSTKANHNIDKQQYKVRLEDDYHGLVSYQKRGNTLYLNYSEVPKALRGKSYGSVLLEAVLETIESEGYTVVPVCSYIKYYMSKHNKRWNHLLAKQ